MAQQESKQESEGTVQKQVSIDGVDEHKYIRQKEEERYQVRGQGEQLSSQKRSQEVEGKVGKQGRSEKVASTSDENINWSTGRVTTDDCIIF